MGKSWGKAERWRVESAGSTESLGELPALAKSVQVPWCNSWMTAGWGDACREHPLTHLFSGLSGT